MNVENLMVNILVIVIQKLPKNVGFMGIQLYILPLMENVLFIIEKEPKKIS